MIEKDYLSKKQGERRLRQRRRIIVFRAVFMPLAYVAEVAKH